MSISSANNQRKDRRGKKRVRGAKDGEVKGKEEVDVEVAKIRNFAEPTYEELTDPTNTPHLTPVANDYDYEIGEKRLQLLAMKVMEAAFLEMGGWSKKERFDAASKALQLVKGTKSSINVKDERDGKMPSTREELEKERAKLEKRLVGLIGKEALQAKDIDMVDITALTVGKEVEDGEN